MVMARISRELMALIAIRHVEQSEGQDPYIIYERAEGNSQEVRYALRYDRDDDELRLHTGVGGDTLDDTANGDLLADGVSQFSFNYFEGQDPWTSGDIKAISMIAIQMELSRRDTPDHPQRFSTRVYLRKIPYISDFISSDIWRVAAFLPVLGCMGGLIRRKRKSFRNSTGNALVVVVVSILIFSVLAAADYSHGQFLFPAGCRHRRLGQGAIPGRVGVPLRRKPVEPL
jgi:hypothetical protein